MFKKYLVVASKQDPAGINIISQLNQFKKNPVLSAMSSDKSAFDISLVEESILYEKNFDLNKLDEYDFIIFASKHKSEKPNKTLSIHCPGNWRTADFGGEKGKTCKSSALFNKFLFEKLKETYENSDVKNYDVTMEVTHHGPLIDKPCVFIEIGSTETEWKDKRAGFVIAKTISQAVDEFKENPYIEVAIGIGGPHYCPSFNKIQSNSNFAISHVIPGYAVPITKEMVLEAVEKTIEEVDFALVDWKGLGNSNLRQEVLNILDENYVQWKKTTEVKKN